ncbi:MAG TPA: hypothetical protein VEB69_06385 [Acidimicrobiia bacterium]|nr:hypothetical protein [Acidimicrobiia bacterium]
MTPEIALAASAREWPDRLHRFLLDHGGGRIVDRVMSAEQAGESRFDVLLIDDVCSFLSPRLVREVKLGGSEVIGVFAPEDGSDAKRRLLECGISDVIETDASPEEFIEKVGQTLAHRPVTDIDSGPAPSTVSIGITGPSEGVGMTEVGIALASALSTRVSTALVDMDPVWPSVAQRLDLGLHPNIRTAIDHSLHNPDRLGEGIHEIGGLSVVGGRADGGSGSPVSRHESKSLIDALGSVADVVVADLGPVRRLEGGLVREFDSVIVVGSGGPVGVARLIRTLADVTAIAADHPVLAVVNQPGRGSFRLSETMSEIANAFPGLPVVTLPFDQRIVEAAWDGELASGRAFRRAMESMADVVVRVLA